MHFTCRSFIGISSGQNFWSQYWENEPDDATSRGSRGHLFGLISLSADEDPGKTGHDIIAEVNQVYFSDTTSLPLSALEQTLKTVTENPLYQLDSLSLVLAAVIDHSLYLAVYDTGHVFLVRGSQFAHLVAGKTGQVVTLSGPVRAQDKIFLLNQNFLENFTLEKVKVLLAPHEIEAIEESALSHLHSLSDQTGLAAALIQVQADEDDNISNSPSDTFEPSPVTPPPVPQPRPQRRFSLFSRRRRQGVYVSPRQLNQLQQRKKINIALSIILLSALAVSCYFGFRKNQAHQAEVKYQRLKSQLEEKLATATTVRSLNLDSALEIAQEAQTVYDQLSALNLHPDETTAFESKISNILTTTGASQGSPSDSFYDLSLIVDDPSYSQIYLSGSTLYLLDSAQGRIDTLDVSDKSVGRVVESDKFQAITRLVEIDRQLFVLTDNGVYRVDGPRLSPQIDFADFDNQPQIVDFATWNSAIYLLDTANSTIWKVAPTASGYGTPQEWLKSGQNLPQDATSLAINGQIWVISSSGQVTPFDRGNRADFSQPSVSDITSADNLVTHPEFDFIIFSTANSVIVYGKDGQAPSRYNFGDTGILDIGLDVSSSSLYILGSDQKLHQIVL